MDCILQADAVFENGNAPAAVALILRRLSFGRRQDEFEKVWNGIIFGIHSGPSRGLYNTPNEWAATTTPLAGQPLADESLAALTMQLPPLYQVIWENRPAAGF